jgi:hypothetical protein
MLHSKKASGFPGVMGPKIRGKFLLRRNLWYYAVDARSRLKDRQPGKIFTGAKRSPKLFFDYGAKAAT